MAKLLRILVLLFGVICCIIATAHILMGSAAIPGSVPVNATMDSEDRFYATVFLGFGAGLVWCSAKLAERRNFFGALLAIFFAGGLARIVSWASVGQPNTLFVFLGALELLLPPILWFWSVRLWHQR